MGMQRSQRIVLQKGGIAAANGLTFQVNGDYRELTFYIYGAGVVSSGAITCEEAPVGYGDGLTWAAIGSPTTVTADTVKVIHATACVGQVRARISTLIGGGGNVTVELIAN